MDGVSLCALTIPLLPIIWAFLVEIQVNKVLLCFLFELKSQGH